MQKPAPTKRRTALGAAIFGALLSVFPQTAAAGVAWPDKADSPTSSAVSILYFIVFGFGVVAIAALLVFLARAVRTEVDPDAVAEQGEKPSKAWTIVGGYVFVALAVVGVVAFSSTSSAKPSLSGVGNDFNASPFEDSQLRDPTGRKAPKGPSISVHANGQQFLWRYRYPGVKGDWNTYSYHDLVIPVGVTVMLDVTSSDVEHSWWVPELGGSIDALPGYINRGWIRADKAGRYDGHSTKVSGSNYATMSTSVVALPPELYKRWAAGKQIEITEAMDALGDEVRSGVEKALVTDEPEKSEAGE